MKSTFTLLSFCLLFLLSFSCDGQILLQLEKYKVDQAEKFYIGQRITFKTKDFPKEWRSEKIERIIPSDNLIIVETGMVNVDDIIEFRTYNEAVNAVSVSLKTFAAAWLLYGGIAYVAADFDFGWDTAIVGGSAYISGWLLKKLFYKNTYKLGGKHRLRIIDITWPDPKPILRP